MLPAVGVLDRQQGQVGRAGADRVGGGAQGLVAGQQRALLASGVAALGGEVAVGALDALVGDAQRRLARATDVGLLVRDRHLEDHPVEPLGLMGVEPLGHGRLPDPLQDLLLARRVAKGEGAVELGRDHPLDQVHAPAQRREDLVVDLLDALADRLQLAGLRHGGQYSGRENPPPSRGNPVSPPENRFPAGK